MSRVQDTLIDTLFDRRYRIIRRLGSGGMANVYLAEDTELGRRVAIKILNDRYANDDLFVERFRREAKSAAALSHPNIVSIYDRGEAEGTYYIAMEVIEGRSLKEVIRGERRLRPAVAIAYTRQILEALRFAHRNGIIHRDIKPHNILVSPDERLKVTDFGIARAGASQMTEAGSIMGTAQYLSPEQARGGEVSAASDLYSLGVVLYEMLTGEVPFNGDNPVEIAMKHTTEPPRPPSARADGIPPALDQVVLRALAKNPADRYQSAAEFDSDLARIEAGLPVASETAEAATAVLSGTSTLAPTEVLRPRTGGGGPPGGRRPPYDPYQRPRRKRRMLPFLLVALLLAVLGGAGWYIYQQVNDRLIESRPVTVPFVVGIKEELAKQRIRDAGLVPVVKREASDTVDPGFVIRQSPDASTKIPKNEKVTIWVSTGKEQVTVPDVVGKPLDEATQLIVDAGLKPEPREVFSKKPEGTVVDQNPPANEKVAKGSVVVLKYSKGQQLVDVPNVIGQDQATAEQTLRDAGFQPSVSSRESDQPEGTVIDQTPNGGQAPKGSTVQIVVSSGPPPPQTATVPGVIGMSEQDAVDTLNNAGFAVNEKPFPVDPSQDGIVQNQEPAEGTELPKGSTVTIYVGRASGGDTTTTSAGTTTG
jgi:serine/threonine-protein kinase